MSSNLTLSANILSVKFAQEIWHTATAGRYECAEYAYDLIDYPATRRRAFHMHDVPTYLA